MTRFWILGAASLFVIASTVLAQEPDKRGQATAGEEAAATEEQKETGDKPPAPMSLIPKLPDYSGDIWSRRYLTGDWGGARTEMAEHGIIFSSELTQIMQVNAHGGADTKNGFRYSGSIDYTVKLDTARMGLWPAGLLVLKGETQFGQSVLGKVGSVMAPNADALFPIPDDPGITTLTDVVFTQFLSEKFGFALGKIDYRGGDQNLFAHDETTQFMNLAFVANPIMLRTAPYSSLTAGVFFRPTEWLTVSFTALDSFGGPTTSGFDTAFHSPEGTTYVTEWDFTVQPFGLPGHQRFGASYSTRDYFLLNQDVRTGGLEGLRQVMQDPKLRPDDWAIYYNFDQYVYVEEDDPTQGVGLFGRFGWATGEANPFDAFYSIGVGGKGIIPKRDNDTFGVGYYFLDMSDDLPGFLGLSSEQGVELYYDFEIAPWLHVTPDLQVIVDPGGSDDRDVAIVCGIRTRMSF